MQYGQKTTPLKQLLCNTTVVGLKSRNTMSETDNWKRQFWNDGSNTKALKRKSWNDKCETQATKGKLWHGVQKYCPAIKVMRRKISNIKCLIERRWTADSGTTHLTWKLGNTHAETNYWNNDRQTNNMKRRVPNTTSLREFVNNLKHNPQTQQLNRTFKTCPLSIPSGTDRTND